MCLQSSFKERKNKKGKAISNSRKSSASKQSKKMQRKVDCKLIKRRSRANTYSLDNVVVTNFTSSLKDISSDINQSTGAQHQIIIPEYKFLSETYYYPEENKVAEDENKEIDEDEQYVERHKPYELAESCNNFLKESAELPAEFKKGLKVTIHLSKTNDENTLLIE